MSKNLLKASIILNLLTFTLVLIGIIITFTIGTGALASNKIDVFKFFTLQSNVLMAAISLVVAFYQFKILKGKINELPYPLVIMNFIAVTGIAITFFIVVTFLGGLYGYDKMYNKANLFFHLLAPVCAIANFLFIECDRKVEFKFTPLALLHCFIYGIVYFIVVAANNAYGNLDIDFYGFGTGGPLRGVLNFSIVLVFAYAIAMLLYYVNILVFKKRRK